MQPVKVLCEILINIDIVISAVCYQFQAKIKVLLFNIIHLHNAIGCYVSLAVDKHIEMS